MWKVKLMKKVSLEFILDDVTYKKNLNISFLYLRSVIIKRFNVVVLFVCLFFLPDSASTGVRDWLELVSAKSPDRTVKLGSAGRADWAAFEKNKQDFCCFCCCRKKNSLTNSNSRTIWGTKHPTSSERAPLSHSGISSGVRSAL